MQRFVTGLVLALALCFAAQPVVASEKPGYLGFGFEVDPTSGLLTVAYVVPSSPAETAGIRALDVLTMISGTEVRFASHRQALDTAGGKVRVGVPVELTFRRAGRSLSTVVVPVEPPKDLAAKNEGALPCADSALPKRSEDLPP